MKGSTALLPEELLFATAKAQNNALALTNLRRMDVQSNMQREE
ncbi:hypothetical protein ACFPVY_02505 [Flavobacterium qiangtangense]|uniref:TolC family protein n=1 Tax=Flavobacterium qiangtangense TaxID=1442595 RepID=A0ABW1PIQ7_9FLAO